MSKCSKCPSKIVSKVLSKYLGNSGTSRGSHQRCSVKKVFLRISQNSQENICARASFLIKLQAKNMYSYKTPLVAASADPGLPQTSAFGCFETIVKGYI